MSGVAIQRHADVGVNYSGDYDSGIVVPNDMYITATLADWVPANGPEADFYFRSDTADSVIFYDVYLAGNGDSTSTIILIDQNGGIYYEDDTAAISAGDVFTVAVVGQNLYLYQNGVLLTNPSTIGTGPTSGVAGLFVLASVAASDVGWSNFIIGSAALGPNASSGSTFNAAVRIPGRSDRDYLHLLNSSGQVIGWIDPNGLLGGSLGTTGAALPTVRAQWTIPGTASRDFIHFIDQEGDIVAWIDFTGKYQTTGSPAYRAEKVLTGSPTQDFLQITNSLGAEIGWIDYTGALNGTL